MTGVMGFLAQCEICPQKAILTDQPDGWVCPRCTEVTAPPVRDPREVYPWLRRGDRVAVQLGDGTIRTGRYEPSRPDYLEAQSDAVKRGQESIASVIAMCERLAADPDGIGGFGDVDVAAAEGVALQESFDEISDRHRSCCPTAADPTPEPMPLTVRVDDPLAVAILAECRRSPDNPLITAVVNGRRFVFGGYTQTRGEPLATVWADRATFTLPEQPQFTHYPWGDPIPEDELPYRPPTKDHAYRAPAAPDDDEPDYGAIRG